MSRSVKRIVDGSFVKLLFHKQEHRGMQLIEFETRCVKKGEVHELVTTIHKDAKSGDSINQVGFLGFAEMDCSGVIEIGDQVKVDGKIIGTVLGFDDCHFPNHYNILIATVELLTADSLNLEIDAKIMFGKW